MWHPSFLKSSATASQSYVAWRPPWVPGDSAPWRPLGRCPREGADVRAGWGWATHVWGNVCYLREAKEKFPEVSPFPPRIVEFSSPLQACLGDGPTAGDGKKWG